MKDNICISCLESVDNLRSYDYLIQKITENEVLLVRQDNNNECYACATQRDKCEHDGRDDSEDYPEWWEDV